MDTRPFVADQSAISPFLGGVNRFQKSILLIVQYKYSQITTIVPAPKRVPGLPIRNCADISNNLVQRCAQLSAVDVRENMIFERLYLISGLGTFGP